MSDDLIGQSCALLTAITWALAMVLFKRSGETVTPVALNLFKNTLGLLLIGITLVVWNMVSGVEVNPLSEHSHEEILILLVSGFLGIAVADTVFFYALNLVGVGIQSIVDCLYSPFVILFAYLLLSESLTLFHYLGAGLILFAVLTSSRHEPLPNRTRGQMSLGVLLGAVSMVLMAYGIVLARPVLKPQGGDFPLLWATILRLLAGTVPLAVWGLVSSERQAVLAVFRPSPVWKVCIPGSVLGAYFSMILWIAGFKYVDKTGIAGVLNQTSTIFAIILASMFLKEPFSRRKLLGVILAMIGVGLVTTSGWLEERLDYLDIW